MYLGRIWIFPIKSLDGLEISEATITGGGILENDRIYAIFDDQGRVVNGKRTARVHQLRSAFDPALREVSLWESGTPAQFCLDAPEPINKWLSDFFGFPVELKTDPKAGFPDDRTAYGPTIVSEASLETVRQWYPGLSLESVRRRFRTNLELTGGDPFCEDRLYGSPGELKPFRIGEVDFFGHNPCQRCVVPTRDAISGEVVPGFQKKFIYLRQEQLPPWANAKRFNHFYRFAVNTSIPSGQSGRKLRAGDPVLL